MVASVATPFRRLPPYSPDLKPNRARVAKLKSALKGFEARIRDALDVAIAAAWTSSAPTTPEGARGDCGGAGAERFAR